MYLMFEIVSHAEVCKQRIVMFDTFIDKWCKIIVKGNTCGKLNAFCGLAFKVELREAKHTKPSCIETL